MDFNPHEAWFLTDAGYSALVARYGATEPPQSRTWPDGAERRPDRIINICPLCGGDDSPGFCLRCEVRADPQREGLYPSVARICLEIQEVGFTSQDGQEIGPWTEAMRESRSQYPSEPVEYTPTEPRLFYDDGGWESTRL